jgi:hypothetical protein
MTTKRQRKREYGTPYMRQRRQEPEFRAREQARLNAMRQLRDLYRAEYETLFQAEYERLMAEQTA